MDIHVSRNAALVNSGRRIRLPSATGSLTEFVIPEAADWSPRGAASLDRARVFYAAPHVVAAPGGGAIDWEPTLAFREHLWSSGLGVAEAMDTAQRGMGLGWADTRRLIELTADAADGRPLVCGVGTDQLAPGVDDLDTIADAYLEQLDVVESAGATAVVMASRHLAAAASGLDDYVAVYERVLGAARRPVVLHWLGEVFDPSLRGYWGTTDVDLGIQRVADLIASHAEQIDGIKVSLLQAELEVRLRAALPAGVRMYTGDDYSFPELIAGDGDRHSGALLGAFNPLADLAGVALDRFDEGADGEARRVLEVGLPLSKRIFEAPTQFYKAGVALVAWLGGHQERFEMLDALEERRDIEHYAQVFVLAAEAGILRDVDLAEHRMRSLLTARGVDA